MDGVLSNIQIEVNGRSYGIGCDDDQEEHIRRLVRQFDNHVKNLAQNVGQIGDQKLFLMAALLLADEAHELKQKLSSTEAELARLRDQRIDSSDAQKGMQDKISEFETQMQQLVELASQSFDSASSRLTNIADKLDNA
ncbi:MAG: cell division protein ZapA [Caulobacterales bacterium]|nr:cell division protein ZapA [Caulobacterales bacterium]